MVQYQSVFNTQKLILTFILWKNLWHERSHVRLFLILCLVEIREIKIFLRIVPLVSMISARQITSKIVFYYYIF